MIRKISIPCLRAFGLWIGLVATGFSATVSDQAFRELVSESFPLTPKQIHKYRTIQAEEQQAVAQIPGDAPPKGTSNIIPVSLKPGSTSPVIRVGKDMISSVVFTDAKGQSWPIASFSLGNPAAFNVFWDKKGAVMMVQGREYGQTNIGVQLKGLDVPVMLTLLVGQQEWDYLDYVRVNANAPVGDNAFATPATSQAPSYLISLIQGIPPVGSAILNTSDANVRAWKSRGKYLLLTRATLLSPAWQSRADGPGPDNMHAYEITPTPFVMLSQNGKLQKVQISGAELNDQKAI